MIDINKKYRLRNGWEARIYATDRCVNNVHAAYKHPDHGWICANWHPNGNWHHAGMAHDYDLFEVKPLAEVDEIERLRAENERLRWGVERIADVSEKWADSLTSQINEIARDALNLPRHK
jgi:hypothetical protein